MSTPNRLRTTLPTPRDENGETTAERAKRLREEGYSNRVYNESNDPFVDDDED